MGTEISRKELRNPILCSNPTQPHLVSLLGLASEDAAEKSGQVPSIPWATGTRLQQETSARFPLQTQAKREKLCGSENQSDGDKLEPLKGLVPQKVHLRHCTAQE